ncbi:hypothetical protein J1N35_010671 [Gossypium stocksii]|uniref:Uncharacterized protein n=1 Tax=Gossypium stocksii TaxID=47602 RepID=A0A9D4ACI3_9ROSI|nr:hypothetical protein J1N35_010671 [Gossypium stocksii]
MPRTFSIYISKSITDHHVVGQSLQQAKHFTMRVRATSLSPALWYTHALLTHNLPGRRKRNGVVSTTDAYFLWSMATGHIFDLAYFIALTFRHQTNYHRTGPICLGPYMTLIARHIDLLDTLE